MHLLSNVVIGRAIIPEVSAFADGSARCNTADTTPVADARKLAIARQGALFFLFYFNFLFLFLYVTSACAPLFLIVSLNALRQRAQME